MLAKAEGKILKESMNYFTVSSVGILIDTGVFYAFYNRRDIHHLDSICLITHVLEGKFGRPYTSEFVVSETYTLLRYRLGYNTALAFLRALSKSDIEIIFTSKDDFEEIVKILEKYSERKLSFTDATLIHLSKNYGIETIASYDERSFSGVLRIIGKNYSKTLSKTEVERIIRLIGE